MVSVTVSVEPWDSKSGFSSRIVWRDASGHRPMCNMLTVGELAGKRIDVSHLVSEFAP